MQHVHLAASLLFLGLSAVVLVVLVVLFFVLARPVAPAPTGAELGARLPPGDWVCQPIQRAELDPRPVRAVVLPDQDDGPTLLDVPVYVEVIDGEGEPL
jgi:hypothetical protein